MRNVQRIVACGLETSIHLKFVVRSRQFVVSFYEWTVIRLRLLLLITVRFHAHAYGPIRSSQQYERCIFRARASRMKRKMLTNFSIAVVTTACCDLLEILHPIGLRYLLFCDYLAPSYTVSCIRGNWYLMLAPPPTERPSSRSRPLRFLT